MSKPPTERLPPCSACLSAEDERVSDFVAGMPVARCVNPVTCRMRAQRSGVWGRTSLESDEWIEGEGYRIRRTTP